jgi:hypothetical protein
MPEIVEEHVEKRSLSRSTSWYPKNKNVPAIQITRNSLGTFVSSRETCQNTELGNWTYLELRGSRNHINRGIQRPGKGTGATG